MDTKDGKRGSYVTIVDPIAIEFFFFDFVIYILPCQKAFNQNTNNGRLKMLRIASETVCVAISDIE